MNVDQSNGDQLNAEQSLDDGTLSPPDPPAMDRRSFLLALSGSAFVLASGALLAGCGGGGGGNSNPLTSSSSTLSSSSSDSLGSSSSSSSGAFLYAGHYKGITSLKLSDGSTDNGSLVFDVDGTGKLTGIYTDVTYGGTAPVSGTVPINGAGSGSLSSQNISGTGQFTVGPSGLITVSGNITGHDATGTLSIVTGTFSATTSGSSSSSSNSST